MPSVCDQLLLDALTIISALEEAIALHDPYNSIEDRGTPTLSDCDFPDHIEDPLALIRASLGDEHAERLEFDGDLQYIAETLQSCVDAELRAQGRSAFDLEAEED